MGSRSRDALRPACPGHWADPAPRPVWSKETSSYFLPAARPGLADPGWTSSWVLETEGTGDPIARGFSQPSTSWRREEGRRKKAVKREAHGERGAECGPALVKVMTGAHAHCPHAGWTDAPECEPLQLRTCHQRLLPRPGSSGQRQRSRSLSAAPRPGHRAHAAQVSKCHHAPARRAVNASRPGNAKGSRVTSWANSKSLGGGRPRWREDGNRGRKQNGKGVLGTGSGKGKEPS